MYELLRGSGGESFVVSRGRVGNRNTSVGSSRCSWEYNIRFAKSRCPCVCFLLCLIIRMSINCSDLCFLVHVLFSPVVHLAPKPWSTLQIVTPFISAILSIIITLFSASIYRRYNLRNVKWRDEFVHRLRPPQKVKSVQQLGAEWEIEPQELRHHEEGVTTKVDEPFVFVDASTSPGAPDTIPGHPSRYSESSGGINSTAAGGGSDTIPGNPSRYSQSSGGTRERTAVDRPGVGRGYPFGPTHQIQARTHLIPVRYLPDTSKNGSSTDSELDTNRRWRFPGSDSFKGIHIPRPWKRVPEKLVEVQPTKRFRVDPRTSGSASSQSMEGTEMTRGSATTSYPRRSFDIADHLGESDSPDYRDYVHEGGMDAGSDNEGTNLISHEEREERRRVGEVKTRSLARSSGTGTMNTSSTNPNINVVSPTVSSSSPKSTRIPAPLPSKVNVCPSFILLTYTHSVQLCLQAAVPVIPPVIPPPPTQPAPSAPTNIFKRVLPRRRENIVEPSIDQQPIVVPDRVTMTPIQEDRSEEGKNNVRSSPSPIPIQSNSNNQQGTSGPGPSRIVPKRTPSDDPPKPSPSPAPSISGQALPYYLRAHQRAPSPSPSLHENPANASPNLKPQTSLSRLLPFEPLSPPTYSHQRTASASGSVISLTRTHDDIYGDPALPRAQIRRGLSADDAANINLMLDPLSAVPPRNGSPRPQVGRDDVGALFPASVRGAGYRGTPNN